jgi:hypothetical protein
LDCSALVVEKKPEPATYRLWQENPEQPEGHQGQEIWGFNLFQSPEQKFFSFDFQPALYMIF